MTDATTYRSLSDQVLEDWETYKSHVEDVHVRRSAIVARFGGRNLMVNRLGFGHGTRVVGFEVLDGELPGHVVADGQLRIPKGGDRYGTAVPNLRRKAGKELETELDSLSQQGPTLAGMPPFALVGFRSLAPALFEGLDGPIYAYWAGEVGNIDAAHWEPIPLSTYFTAKETSEGS